MNCKITENEITETFSSGYDTEGGSDFPIVNNAHNEGYYESMFLAPYGLHSSPVHQCFGAQMHFNNNPSESYVIVNDYARMAQHQDLYKLEEGEVIISDTLTLSFLKFYHNKDVRLLSESDSYFRTKRNHFTHTTGNDETLINGTEKIEVDKDVTILYKQNCQTEIDGNDKLLVKGTQNIEVDQDVTITAKENVNVTISGNCTVNIQGNADVTVSGSTMLKSTTVTVDSPMTTITGNVAIAGNCGVAGTLTADSGATTMSGGGMSMQGSLTAQGDLTSQGAVTAGGVGLQSHTHVDSEGGTTSPAQ